MRCFSGFLLSALLVMPALAAASGGTVLEYKVMVRLRDGGRPLESRMQVVTLPPVETHNKIKHPRLVGWQVKALPGKGGLPSAAVRNRLESLLYLEGPSSGLVPREGGLRFGKRFCRFWQAQTPASVGAFVYLVEVAPDLLALAYLSASLPDGELATIEIHLEKATLARNPAPAADGMVLLRTLRSWGALLEDDEQVMKTEEIR